MITALLIFLLSTVLATLYVRNIVKKHIPKFSGKVFTLSDLKKEDIGIYKVVRSIYALIILIAALFSVYFFCAWLKMVAAGT